MTIRELIRADISQYNNGLSDAITSLGFYAVLFYRISRYFSDKGFLWGAGFLQAISHVLTGAQISHKADIGPGLKIPHPVGVVIGHIKLGKIATIYQGSTISQMYYDEKGPVIGDFFCGCPGSVIMGSIKIGDYVWVGPNSVLFISVASNVKVLGNPAKVLPAESKKMV